MKTLLIITILMLVTSVGSTQVDPLGIINQKKAAVDGYNIRGIQLLAMDNWERALTYLDTEKLAFFYLNDYVSFIDYIYGTYSHSPDASLTELAYRKSNFCLANLSLYNRSSSQYQKLFHIEETIKELRSFNIIRYVDDSTRLLIWRMVKEEPRG